MIRMLLGALSVIITVSACTSDESPRELAMGACGQEAVEALETAGVSAEQRSTWIDEYTRQCMAKKGY